MGGKLPRTRFTCWGCGKDVPLKYSGKACPNCGAPLTPRAYDHRAKELTAQRHEVELELSRDLNELSAAAERNARWGILGRLPFLPSRRTMKRLTKRSQQLREQISEMALKTRLGADRYYASEWFRQSQRFLRADTPDPRVNKHNPFKTPYYDQDGMFHMLPDGSDCWKRGEFGEYVVFSLLSDAIEDGTLGHARLLWHLYIPSGQYAETHAERTDEVDIVLLTTHGLYSIEVKSLHSFIEVRPDSFWDTYLVTATAATRDGRRIEGQSTVSKGVGQNASHVKALRDELAGVVPPSRIFNVTVYTNHCDFEMLAPQGLHDAYVTTTSECPENVIDVIRLIERKTGTRWSDVQVDELADQLSIAYADPDGSKQAEHAKAMEMAKERKAAHASSTACAPSAECVPFSAPAKHHKRPARKSQKPKARSQAKYQKRKSTFIEEDVYEYLNGDYDEYAG